MCVFSNIKRGERPCACFCNNLVDKYHRYKYEMKEQLHVTQVKSKKLEKI